MLMLQIFCNNTIEFFQNPFAPFDFAQGERVIESAVHYFALSFAGQVVSTASPEALREGGWNEPFDEAQDRLRE